MLSDEQEREFRDWLEGEATKFKAMFKAYPPQSFNALMGYLAQGRALAYRETLAKLNRLTGKSS